MGGFSIGCGIGIGPRTSAEQIIWRVLISGAGEESSNGEYVWDGVNILNEQRVYVYAPSYTSSIYFNGSVWILEDGGFEGNTYYSFNLSTWISLDITYDPAPTAQLFYTP